MHNDSSVNAQLITPPSENQQDQSHDCAQNGEHCCHAMNHLLGQVSDDFILNKLSKEPNLFLFGVVNATSTHPEDIYRPPRFPSLT